MFEPETELVPAPDGHRAERQGQKSARDQRGDREVVAAVLENSGAGTMKMTVYLALISDCSTEFILAMEMDLMWSQLKALVYAVKALLADVACNSLMGSLMISWQSG